jgi:hypothetical protein
VTGILVYLLDRKGRSDLCFAAFALLMAAFFAAGTRGMQLVEDQLSSAKVAGLIGSRAGPHSMVIVQGNPNDNTTLFFYLRQPVFWVDGNPEIEFATRSLGIGRAGYLTRQQVLAPWKDGRQVFLITEGTEAAEWGRYLGFNAAQSNPVGRCGSRVIFTNK